MWIRCNVFVLVLDVHSGDHDLAWDYRLLARQLVLRDKASSLGLVDARLAILQKLGYCSRTYLTLAQFGLVYSTSETSINYHENLD